MPQVATAIPEIVASLEKGLATIRIYGTIGDVVNDWSVASAVDWINEDARVQQVQVRINSSGGSAYCGMGIYSALCQCTKPLSTYVDGVALSAASLAAIAAASGGKRYMARNGRMMIHAPRYKDGTPADAGIHSLAAAYRDTYLGSSTLTEEQLDSMLAADTWLSPDQCLEYGLVDELFDNGLKPIQAQAPADMVAEAAAQLLPPTDMTKVKSIVADADAPVAVATPEVVAALQEEVKQLTGTVKSLTAEVTQSRDTRAMEMVASYRAKGAISEASIPAWEKAAKADYQGTKDLLDSFTAPSTDAPAPTPAPSPAPSAQAPQLPEQGKQPSALPPLNPVAMQAAIRAGRKASEIL